MRKREIIRNNKLIAEFMIGKAIIQNSGVYVNRKVFIISGRDYLTDRLEYYSSWEWLMPVMEKIESLEYEFIIYGKQFGQFSRNYRTFIYFDLKRHKRIGEIIAEGKTSKEATYKAVIKFIKWYNKKFTAVPPNKTKTNCG